MAKSKILFLHGYTQSGNTLRYKTAALCKALAKHAEVCFPTGPILVEPPDATDLQERNAQIASFEGATASEEGAFAWWRASDSAQDFLEIDKTMSMLKSLLEREGPFDGVMGFSQGGCLAAILASCLERHNPLLSTTHPPLKFAIVFSGFKSRFKVHDYIYHPEIKTPILHVIGQNDTIVSPERSQDLVTVCANATTLYHPGSHFVPSAAPYRAKILNHIIACTRPKMQMTCIVAATSRSLGIGKNGSLPWRLKKEMTYFTKVTSSAPIGKTNAVIMGRNSWESIPPKFRPLKNRINIVVSKNQNLTLTGNAINATPTSVVSGLDEALVFLAREYGESIHRIFVIGGSQLYQSALEHCETHRILLTSINREFDCDVSFPVDFRYSKGEGEGEGVWERKEHDALTEFVGIDVDQDGEEENGVSWGYEMWERRETAPITNGKL